MNGYSLLELTAALLLLALASSAVVPAAGRHRDRMLVLTARETLVAALRDTRAEALRTGTAALHLTAADGRGRIISGDSAFPSFLVDPSGRVSLSLSRGRADSEIGFGGLGIGVFANETLELTAGAARARLVVSSYGRVRRE